MSPRRLSLNDGFTPFSFEQVQQFQRGSRWLFDASFPFLDGIGAGVDNRGKHGLADVQTPTYRPGSLRGAPRHSTILGNVCGCPLNAHSNHFLGIALNARLPYLVGPEKLINTMKYLAKDSKILYRFEQEMHCVM
jgi:hypothetical protein